MIILLLTIFSKAIEIYLFVLIAYALLSWFPGAYQTKVGEWIIKLARPYLSLFDRLNLSVGPMDFTVLVAIIALQLSSQAIVMIIGRLLVAF
ncbi:YggT family protein [Vagococcus sp.]|uniref:YggT family protein n=1 Tax=Vagococcus sp. TaxID=1933889 RepID=UPI003F9D7CE6